MAPRLAGAGGCRRFGAELIEAGEPLPDELVAAAGHGTAVGGARPKAVLSEGRRHWIAKFSSSTDDRPVVKAEAVGMLLAARAGLDVAPVQVTRCAGRDVLLVERFDRTAQGHRLMVVSALTVLGLDEASARYGSYAELASAMRFAGWPDPARQMRELFTRMVLNISVSNTDDHLRNHAAFWDGSELSLTPAFDVAPQRRSTSVATHAIGLSADGERTSQFRVARKAAGSFGITQVDAGSIIDGVQDTIRTNWSEVCDEAQLSRVERDQLWRREILPEHASWDGP
ncbi:MAG TPA: HipA domain-containing protein [Acidimicrobiales bacterium]|nr:HipA domain-containing protein [Acidimicrobiales bacterium]